LGGFLPFGEAFAASGARLARISQRGRCIGALDLRKSNWTNGLSQD
jgi:hypothetical protein